jgi:hypothetical protein
VRAVAGNPVSVLQLTLQLAMMSALYFGIAVAVRRQCNRTLPILASVVLLLVDCLVPLAALQLSLISMQRTGAAVCAALRRFHICVLTGPFTSIVGTGAACWYNAGFIPCAVNLKHLRALTLAIAMLPVHECLVVGSKVAEMPHQLDWSFDLNGMLASPIHFAFIRFNAISRLENTRSVLSFNWHHELLFLPSAITRVNASSGLDNRPRVRNVALTIRFHP